MSRSARKGLRQSASTWRKRDRKYREEQAERRRANILRRAEVAAAEQAGLPVDVWRAQQAEAEA
jgi:hypothetical protein